MDLAEAALNSVYRLNGQSIDRAVGETQADEETDRTYRRHAEGEDEEMDDDDDKMDMEETPAERRT